MTEPPTEVWIGAVVEGQGEVEAVPALIRRIAARLDPPCAPHIDLPIRLSRGKFRHDAELGRALDLAAARVQGSGGVLVMLDSDGDCPARLGPQLLQRAQAKRPDVAISVVVAHCEFESWFLAAAVSLRGRRGLAPDLSPPPDAEAIQGAKGWLSRHMQRGRAYVTTVDQAALVSALDLDAARTAPSFDKCYREIVRLLRGG